MAPLRMESRAGWSRHVRPAGPLGVMPSRRNAPVSRGIAEYGRDTARIWTGPGVSGHNLVPAAEPNSLPLAPCFPPLIKVAVARYVGFATPPSLVALRYLYPVSAHFAHCFVRKSPLIARFRAFLVAVGDPARRGSVACRSHATQPKRCLGAGLTKKGPAAADTRPLVGSVLIPGDELLKPACRDKQLLGL
jgi:hypothetical protein